MLQQMEIVGNPMIERRNAQCLGRAREWPSIVRIIIISGAAYATYTVSKRHLFLYHLICNVGPLHDREFILGQIRNGDNIPVERISDNYQSIRVDGLDARGAHAVGQAGRWYGRKDKIGCPCREIDS